MTPRWLQKLYWLVFLGAFGLWGWGLSQAASRGELWGPDLKGPAKEGRLAPRLKVQQTNGQTTTLRSYRGRWVLVNFWATWCEPCRREMASLERLALHLQQQPFTLLAVSVDANWAVVQKFFRTHTQLKGKSLKMKLLLDPLGAHAIRYGTRKFPETYLIDPKGHLRKKWIGPFVWDSPAMLKQIKAMMALSTKKH